MQKHINASYHADINPVLLEDNSNIGMFFCPDVVGNHRFVLNFGGYPRSEIAQINAAADLNQQINLLQSLEDFTPSENPNAGLTDAEIMLSHRSKYCQTPCEQISWLENQMHERYLQRVAKSPQESEQTTINFSADENNES